MPSRPALAWAGKKLVSRLPEQNRVALGARCQPRENDIDDDVAVATTVSISVKGIADF
jgi:hypothetical protein